MTDTIAARLRGTNMHWLDAVDIKLEAADHIDAQAAKIKALERGNEYMMAELQKHGHIIKFEWFGAVSDGVDDCVRSTSCSKGADMKLFKYVTLSIFAHFALFYFTYRILESSGSVIDNPVTVVSSATASAAILGFWIGFTYPKEPT